LFAIYGSKPYFRVSYALSEERSLARPDWSRKLPRPFKIPTISRISLRRGDGRSGPFSGADPHPLSLGTGATPELAGTSKQFFGRK